MPMNTPNDLAIDRQGRIWFSNPWNAGNIHPSEREVPGLDAEGNIVATAGSYISGPGPMIYIWDPKGRVLETHPMPVGFDTPTNCTFGDPDQRTLYITTGGGHLFRVRNTGRRGWIIWPPVR